MTDITVMHIRIQHSIDFDVFSSQFWNKTLIDFVGSFVLRTHGSGNQPKILKASISVIAKQSLKVESHGKNSLKLNNV